MLHLGWLWSRLGESGREVYGAMKGVQLSLKSRSIIGSDVELTARFPHLRMMVIFFVLDDILGAVGKESKHCFTD